VAASEVRLGIASLVIGIFAAIGAAITTAPCFGIIAIPTAALALLGLALAIAELIRAGWRRTRGAASDPEANSSARTGALVNGLALLWALGMFFATKGIL
jgi:hypothetical protein